MKPSDLRPSPGGFLELWRTAYPLIVSMASFTLMQFADRLFLARYSAEAIQAALPAGMLSFTLLSFFHALCGYTSAFVAQYHGARDAAGEARSTAQGVWLALCTAPLIGLLIPVGNAILKAAGHAPEVLAEEIVYFTRLMAGGFLVTLGSALSGYYNGRGDTRTTMAATVAGNAVNLVLDYAWIFGRWGFPRMGIAGAAWATVAGSATTTLILAEKYVRDRRREGMPVRHLLPWDSALMRRLLRFGAPAAMHLTMDVGSFALFLLLTARLEAVALAANNIAFSINNIAFQPLLGLSMATSILVGQYQGRAQSEIAERAGWTALKAGWIYMGLAGLSFIALPDLYVGLFAGAGDTLPKEALIRTARPLLWMMAAWGMFDTVNLVMIGALRGAGDTRFSMLYSTAIAWLFWIPGELAISVWIARRRLHGPLPDWMGGGIVLLWAWLTLYVVVLCAGLAWRFRSARWKHIRLISRAPVVLPPRTGADAPMVAE